VEKLERFLRGELNVRGAGGVPGVVGSVGGLVGPKGDATPGTPTSTLGRHPPTYQRMHSSDSGKGDSKDINGNSGGGVRGD
jgi:hypothetical protein